MLTEASTTPFCPSSASFDGVSCAWPRVSGRPCVRCELSAYVCVVDSGTARGCVLSHSHPRAVTLQTPRTRDLGTSGRAAAMATAAAIAAAACQHHDRRTASCVLHTPEAECNALPFELGTRNAQRPRISGSNGRASASGGFTLLTVDSYRQSNGPRYRHTVYTLVLVTGTGLGLV